MPRPARTAAVLSLPLLLAACSGGGGGTQSSPQSLTAAVYDDFHAGEFAKPRDVESGSFSRPV